MTFLSVSTPSISASSCGPIVGVLDRLDLVPEAADVLVVDVGDLLEDELLDLRAWQPLEQQARPGIHQDRVAGSQRLVEQPVRELDDALLVGPPDHQGARAVL